MSKWILCLMAAFIGAVFTFTSVTSAADMPAEKKASQPAPATGMKAEPKAAAPKAKSATGDVVSVDAKAGMLTVKGKDKEMTFNAESKTAKSALEKVKAGDRVSVSYTEKDGKMVASSVRAVKKTEAKPAAKTETKDTKTKM